MDITYKRLSNELDDLIKLYTTSHWTFHADPSPSEREIRKRFESGWFTDDRETYWIIEGGEAVGLVMLGDVSDSIPLLYDIRLTESARGKGIGVKTLEWVAQTLFQRSDTVIRIEAFTRVDNVAMRKIFSQSGFVKEGYLRDSWENDDGSVMDSLCYAMIRQDWETGSATQIKIDDVPY
ncbi:GNAT family N-acetyltransferase [Alkalicoccobacillus murimartini]|uniref:RimJ/RimL family protein N-acetyltransferase n=1 Tax=Alkalicoccobacillus murimartini TaxID=171685 RepID=A0ABT9YMK7_9BACI|nr:GNAT family protein [Alkalicoccobacillus murimartini]MDQ0208828.1 RimJ/RimL family protein N-acetyltransferase [Alkalicoccobacillus murimartini]